MSESKPLASLSPSLLARKGTARPAMRPQGLSGIAISREPITEDLGWNDLGHDEAPLAEVVALHDNVFPIDGAPETPAVIHQQVQLAETLSLDMDQPEARKARGLAGKAAFTLRIDPDRHLKLRLLSALSHRSAQHIITAALDAALEAHTSIIKTAKAISSKGVKP